MLVRFVNTSILILATFLTLTGVYGLIFEFNGWLFEVHRMSGWALISLLPWKVGIAWRSLKRGLQPNFKRGTMIGISLFLATLAISVMLTGLLWTWNLGPTIWWLFQTAIAWHWILALALAVPLVIHVLVRWPRPKLKEFSSRRGALKMMGIAAAGVVGWQASEWFARGQAAPQSPRRHTGSRQEGVHTGNNFPITGEWANEIDHKGWALNLRGPGIPLSSLSYADLLARPHHEMDLILDCTTGWWSRQIWRGVPLMHLIHEMGVVDQTKGVAIKSATGYAESFLMDEAKDILLATHVGDEIISHWHGYPLRAVVPSRRGWFWVKWIVEIEALDTIPVDFPDFR